MKKFIITEEVLNWIMTYLYQRPYGEVAKWVEALSSLRECKCDNK
jgi:hypothetical protein